MAYKRKFSTPGKVSDPTKDARVGQDKYGLKAMEYMEEKIFPLELRLKVVQAGRFYEKYDMMFRSQKISPTEVKITKVAPVPEEILEAARERFRTRTWKS